jgi:hypothetical protein
MTFLSLLPEDLKERLRRRDLVFLRKDSPSPTRAHIWS